MANCSIEIHKYEIMGALEKCGVKSTKEKKYFYDLIKSEFPLCLNDFVRVKVDEYRAENFQRKLKWLK